VDDEESLRKRSTLTLDDSAYRIIEAADESKPCVSPGSAARSDRPGLDDAGKTGLEVTRLLRQDASTARTPIILLTAKSREKDRLAGIAAGADAFLAKPFSPLELLEIVERLLERQ